VQTSYVAVGALLVAVGVVFAGFGYVGYQDRKADLENAVEVEGTVESVSVDEDVDRRDRDDDGIRERETSFQPVVEYTYRYEGKRYSSDSVYPGPENSFSDRSSATSVTDRFGEGERTTVYVNGEDPSSAYLVERANFSGFYLFMGVGVVVTLGGLLSAGRGLTTDGERATEGDTPAN
jgi:hypothetical protein